MVIWNQLNYNHIIMYLNWKCYVNVAHIMQIANTETLSDNWLSVLSVWPCICICDCALAQLGGVFTISSAQTGVNNKQTNSPFSSNYNHPRVHKQPRHRHGNTTTKENILPLHHSRKWRPGTQKPRGQWLSTTEYGLTELNWTGLEETVILQIQNGWHSAPPALHLL